MPDCRAFAETYINAFVKSFQKTQADFRSRPRDFFVLFSDRPVDEGGSFAFRWERVLKRLDRADPELLGRIIRDHIAAPQETTGRPEQAA